MTRNEIFAQRIRVALAAAGIKPSWLARECRCSPTLVNHWTTGKRMPNAAPLEIICKATGCSISWLMEPHPVDVRRVGEEA